MLPSCLCFAAEQQTSHSLENYLKRLGYEPIPLKRDHGNHLMVDGQIDGKSHDFMVDTGCTMTTVDSTRQRDRAHIAGQLAFRDLFTDGKPVLSDLN